MRSGDFLTVLAFLALAVAIVKWPRLWRFLRFPGSSSWPTLRATVEQVLIHSYSGLRGTTYRAEIIYSYQVNGEYYSGFSMGDLFYSESEVNDIVKEHPKGTTVEVHVHPTKPQLSVLDHP